jgi:hypothetical protein
MFGSDLDLSLQHTHTQKLSVLTDKQSIYVYVIRVSRERVGIMYVLIQNARKSERFIGRAREREGAVVVVVVVVVSNS